MKRPHGPSGIEIRLSATLRACRPDPPTPCDEHRGSGATRVTLYAGFQDATGVLSTHSERWCRLSPTGGTLRLRPGSPDFGCHCGCNARARLSTVRAVGAVHVELSGGAIEYLPAVDAIPLVIVGAGGFGRETHDVVEAVNDRSPAGGPVFEMVGFVDDAHPDPELIEDRAVPFLGPVEKLAALPQSVQYVIGIGNGAVRRRIDQWATDQGRVAATLIHPSALIGRHRVHVGPGAVICATAVVTTNVRLGRHVHLNLGATVGHDAVLGDYVTVNPNVSISGTTTVEDEVNLGTGSTVIQGRRVGARTVVGAGAAVIRDLPPDVTAVGIPARPR